MKKLSDTYKELGIDFTFPIEIKDAEGNLTYYEEAMAIGRKREYDAKGNAHLLREQRWLLEKAGIQCQRQRDLLSEQSWLLVEE